MLDVFILNEANNHSMLNAIMLNVIMLKVIMLNVIMLNVIMLNVIMLSVVAPILIPSWDLETYDSVIEIQKVGIRLL
jgi:hypothetical protein